MSERRTDKRFAICLDAIWDGAMGNYTTRVVDLSEGGCYIDSIAEAYVGDLLSFKVQLPTGEWLALTGEVAHHELSMGFGVRFVGLDNEQLQTLRWLIASLKRQHETGPTERIEVHAT